MKRIVYCLLLVSITLLPQALSGQSVNSKGGSFRGGSNPFTDQVTHSSYWSGSGIALDKYHVATNNHVVESQTHLSIAFSDDDKRFSAEVVATDEENDLAIIRVSDPSFPGFQNIRYGFQLDNADVGEEVFVLGYPYISYLGTEVKLTTGVISARSGYLGNKGMYQISAPIQPGNSGGPLFNSKGELIGIVSSKFVFDKAENVNYAVKLSHLQELIESCSADINLHRKSRIVSQSLSKKCKATIPYTVRIMADNRIDEEPVSQVFGTPGQYPVRVNDPDVMFNTSELVSIVGIDMLEDRTVLHLWYWNCADVPVNLSFPAGTEIILSSDEDAPVKAKLLETEENLVAPREKEVAPYCYTTVALSFEPIPSDTSFLTLHFYEGSEISVYWGWGDENDDTYY